MPYRRKGRVIEHFINGKWSKKQTCRTPEAAAKAIKLLRGLEHGTIKKRRK